MFQLSIDASLSMAVLQGVPLKSCQTEAKGIGIPDYLQLYHQHPTGFLLFPQTTGEIWSSTAEAQHALASLSTHVTEIHC